MLFPANISTNFLIILLYLVATVMALFVAMPFHEFAHAFAAKREGDFTAVAYGRYTLAPHAHFDWKGFLFLFLFRFGWAKPVPIDSRNFKRGRKSQFIVSIAGILANLILGTFFLFMYLLIYKISPTFYDSSYYGLLLCMFLETSISINFMLAFFNLLPLYPLDGYKMVESCVKYDNAYLSFAKSYSVVIYLILVFTNIYYFYYTYTAGFLIEGLTKLFSLILGL